LTIKRRNQLGLSATKFILLCAKFGIHPTVFILSVALIVTTLVVLGRKWPTLGAFMIFTICVILSAFAQRQD
jgi:hypothetical protein